jgi:hypothetical protein
MLLGLNRRMPPDEDNRKTYEGKPNVRFEVAGVGEVLW